MRMGMRIIIAICLTAVCAAATRAESVSQKMASRMAQTFFNTMYGESTPAPKLIYNGRELTTNRLFTPFYVYNSPRGAYVMIAADSKAYPVLAYSRSRKFDRGDVKEAARDQFERFAREIELIRYDSRIPESAKWAWEHIPDYFTNVLENPYGSAEYRRLTDEAQESLEELDRRNSWIVMPTAVEFDLYHPEQYRDYNLDDVLADEKIEEVPFQFYEDFIRQIDEEDRARAAAYERILIPDKPILKYHGAGAYTIQLPVEAKLMRIYSVSGEMTRELKFKGSNVMNFDLTGMSSGYYIVLALAYNGDIYAFKVHR